MDLVPKREHRKLVYAVHLEKLCEIVKQRECRDRVGKHDGTVGIAQGLSFNCAKRHQNSILILT